MRHRVAGRKLGRKTNHRIAMWRNMAVALFTHEQITTTLPKAKSLQPLVEKLITQARRGDLAARRRITRMLGRDHVMVANDEDENVERNAYGELIGGPKVVKKLVEEIGPRYADRSGGYTRIVKLARHRIGDGTSLCVLQLVGAEEGPNVAGQYSRRREQANRRMERAAALRRRARERGGSSAQPESEPAAVAEEPDTERETAAEAAAEHTDLPSPGEANEEPRSDG